MQQCENASDATPRRGGAFQYSLRTLFVLTTALAVLCSLLFASPGWVRFFSGQFAFAILPAVLVVMLVYGRGYTRTFALGALFPAAACFLASGVMHLYISIEVIDYRFPDFDDLDEVGIAFGVFVLTVGAASLISGLIAVGVRWLVESPTRACQHESDRAQQSEAVSSRTSA